MNNSKKDVFEIYTTAILNSDIDLLFSTITNSSKFCFITSSGRLMQTRQEYYDLHKSWFSEKNWEISFEEPVIKEENDFGYTISLFNYEEKVPGGKTTYLKSYFTLLFHKENNDWKIIADICTPISKVIK